QRGANVLPAAVAGGGVGEPTWIRARVVDDLLQRVLRELAARDERVREAGREAERYEIALGVIRQALVQARGERQVCRRAEEDRIAVGLGLGHGVGADDRAAAGAVLDDHRLPEQRRERL